MKDISIKPWIEPIGSDVKSYSHSSIPLWDTHESLVETPDVEGRWFQLLDTPPVFASLQKPLTKSASRRQSESATLFYPTSIEHSRDRLPSFEGVEKRITELESAALEEGIEIDNASLKGLRNFIFLAEVTNDPSITLRDTGKFRALWEAKSIGQIGIEFEDANTGNYVILRTRLANLMDRHYGSCHFARIDSIVDAVGAAILLKG